MLPEVFLLALGSAVFPMLLAGVAVLLSREKPAPLLFAFWIGGFVTSVIAGMVILTVFGKDASSFGAKGPTLAPPYSIAAGVVIIGVAALIGTSKGRSWIDGWRARRKEHKEERREAKGKPAKAHKDGPSRGEEIQQKMLEGGTVFAGIGGAILNLPGPFYLIALGNIAGKNLGFTVDLVLVLIFNLIMLVLVEIPMIGFVVNPEKTDHLVGGLSKWLNRNGIKIVATLALLFGLSMISKGINDWGHWKKASSAKTAKHAEIAPAGRAYAAASSRS